MSAENEFLSRFLPRIVAGEGVMVPPGDDCAALRWQKDRWLLAAADQIIGDVHYFMDRTSPEEAGAKLLKRNLSDIAAMGGIPRWALLTLAVGKGLPEEYAQAFARGVEQCARSCQMSVVGGDYAALPGERQLVATLSILGEVEPEKIALRANARPGDLVVVSGTLGNTLVSNHHLHFQPRLQEGRWLAGSYTCCMMDISDGLAADLPKLAAASQVDVEVEVENLPLRSGADYYSAWSDGEDYELLFTLPPQHWRRLCREWPFDTLLTVIGRVRSGSGKVYWGEALAMAGGYEHE